MARPIVYGPAGSTYVWSTRLALAEKGVAHELVDVPFGAHREEPHLSRHPFAKVPAFEHDGFALYETQAILRYIDEGFPVSPLHRTIFVKPLPPDLPAELALVRAHLSCAGIYPTTSEHAAHVATLGVSRICPIGRMQLPPWTWQQDGAATLSPLVRWVDFESR